MRCEVCESMQGKGETSGQTVCSPGTEQNSGDDEGLARR